MSPLISIIIPFFNADRYLSRCIDSILCQSLPVEIILIDDGSTDNSKFICEKYSNLDNRCRYYYKNNEGVSSARNLGIIKSTGEWLLFVDADDTLLSDSLSTLLDGINDNVDLVMGGYNVILEDGSIVSEKKAGIINVKNECFLLTRDQCALSSYKPLLYAYEGFIWNRLFRHSIIRDNKILFHNDIYYGEDRIFILEYLKYCNNYIFYTGKPVYNYFHNHGSAMRTIQAVWTPKYLTEFTARERSVLIIQSYSTDRELIRAAKKYVIINFYTQLSLCRSYKIKSVSTFKLFISMIKTISLPFFANYYFSAQYSALKTRIYNKIKTLQNKYARYSRN